MIAEFHDRLRDRVREAAGRDPEPTAGRGIDGGKKVNGRRKPIVVETLGLLLTALLTVACVTDREAGWTLLERQPIWSSQVRAHFPAQII